MRVIFEMVSRVDLSAFGYSRPSIVIERVRDNGIMHQVRPRAVFATTLFAFAALALSACSTEPSPRELVREAADEHFGESSINQIYVTGTSQLCNDLERGQSSVDSLAGATPEAYAFYTLVAVPIMCPEYSGR